MEIRIKNEIGYAAQPLGYSAYQQAAGFTGINPENLQSGILPLFDALPDVQVRQGKLNFVWWCLNTFGQEMPLQVKAEYQTGMYSWATWYFAGLPPVPAEPGFFLLAIPGKLGIQQIVSQTVEPYSQGRTIRLTVRRMGVTYSYTITL